MYIYIYVYTYHDRTFHYECGFERDFSILIVAYHQLLQATSSSDSFIDIHLPVCVSSALKWIQKTIDLLILSTQINHVAQLVAMESSLHLLYESWSAFLLHSYESFIPFWVKNRSNNDFSSIYESRQIRHS